MNPFKNLSVKENEELIKFPAYISLLAEFYLEVDKVFTDNLEQLDKELPREKDRRDAIIKKKLIQLEKIVLKLEKEYSLTMNRSLKSFKENVFKVDHNVLVDFLIPLPIPGLTVS